MGLFDVSQLQGDPNQKFLILMGAVIQKICIPNLEIVKPKCIWELCIYLDCQMFVYNFLNQRKPSKHI